MQRLNDRDWSGILEVYHSLSENKKRLNHNISARWLKEELLSVDVKTYGLKDGEKLMTVLFVRDQVEAQEITFLATHESYSGKGHMKGTIEEFIEFGLIRDQLWLEVHEDNEWARQMYTGIGFKEVGRRERYYSDGKAALLLSYTH